ncbi:MAG TPA: T9SS type A sorting domain-containing protein, partial [Cytophaga sp.]|nr:T9SS type A sorting domain-containing protein [Cytophaga sp.]
VDTLYNLAVVSSDCYNGMPTSYTPPAGRNLPDPVHNITAILNEIPKPDVVIVNFPTNNYDWLSNTEILQCLQTIKDSANAQNVRCYITTTQPRNNFSPTEQQKLKDLQTLILIQFGQWAIDFWTDVVSPDSYLINPVYSLGDGIHLNPAGQTLLEQRVINANIFGSVILAVHLTGFNAIKKDETALLNWTCTDEADNLFTIEKSVDDRYFTSIGNIPEDKNTRYSFTDNKPAAGANYYRICITGSNGQKEYSSIQEIDFTTDGLSVSSISPSVSSNSISFTISTDQRKKTTVSISNIEGKKVSGDEFLIDDKLSIKKDISDLPAGIYFITISTQNEAIQRKFIKQ